jgi:hypothetical protein
LTNLSNSQLGNGNAPVLQKKDKFTKSDYFCHKQLSKDFNYFLELSKVIETNYTFQKIIESKWNMESSMNLELMKNKTVHIK